jgi:signal peptidase
LNKKKFAETIVFAALVVIAIIVLVFYRPTVLAGDTQYEPVYTGSMVPAIGVGSVVAIKPVNPDNLEVGDIICYRFSETTSVTHRIIEVNDEGFITKGDANEDPDQLAVKKEDVIGKVVFTLPLIGYLSSFTRTAVGYICLVVTPAVLLIGFEIKSIIVELKKEKNKPLTPEKQAKPVNVKTTIGNVFNAAILKLNAARLPFVIGTSFLIGGSALWLYTKTVIFGFEQILANPNLALKEVWSYQGSIQWWRTAYVIVVLPVTIILITAGLAIILCPIIYKKFLKPKLDLA